MFDRLNFAYIGGRYRSEEEFPVTREHLDYWNKEARKLLDLTEIVCSERIAAGAGWGRFLFGADAIEELRHVGLPDLESDGGTRVGRCKNRLGPFELGVHVAGGEQAEGADLGEALGQDVQQEAANEFARGFPSGFLRCTARCGGWIPWRACRPTPEARAGIRTCFIAIHANAAPVAMTNGSTMHTVRRCWSHHESANHPGCLDTSS